ncbi:hypothetical protein BJ508DRAFT_327876 [Ascobolus immersus RN42]|uniref:Uncharacterized protein n=1 Tax=Ascobolus immersus RN42 TaxID=1160509 RepID=A0A3N4I6U2_ASCIM|nr:hypothetical protein BJ508DRAFT_327876 [Ascobolus immersus RN42]
MQYSTALLSILAATATAFPTLVPRQSNEPDQPTKTYCFPKNETSGELLAPAAYANLVKRVPTPYVETAWSNNNTILNPAQNSHIWIYSGNKEKLVFDALFLCTYDIDNSTQRWPADSEQYMQADDILEYECGSRAGGVVLFEDDRVAYGRGHFEEFDLTLWDGFNGELGDRCEEYKKKFDEMEEEEQ